MRNRSWKLRLVMSVYAATLLALPCCGDDDDATGDTASETAGETTGTGGEPGSECDNIAGTQPCSCLTTVVAAGTQTCTEKGWTACDCPDPCVEARAACRTCTGVSPLGFALSDVCLNGIDYAECTNGFEPACTPDRSICSSTLREFIPTCNTVYEPGDTTGDETTGE